MTQARFKSLIIILSLGVVLTVNYNNCGDDMQFSMDSKAQLTGGQAPNDDVANDNLDIVQKTCMNSTPQVMEHQVSFINPESQSCNFGQGDNLSALNGFFRARIEQKSDFALPAGATICGMSFEFATTNAQMVYDDHFLVTFNGVVLASTFDFSADFDHILGMNVYSWDKIRGSDWDGRKNLEGVHCEGAKDGKAACSWPQTEQFGNISMRFDDVVFQKIFATNPTRSQHSFGLVSIGDNDSGDCQISPISFKAKVQYVK